jgi:hypothetical protein
MRKVPLARIALVTGWEPANLIHRQNLFCHRITSDVPCVMLFIAATAAAHRWLSFSYSTLKRR